MHCAVVCFMPGICSHLKYLQPGTMGSVAASVSCTLSTLHALSSSTAPVSITCAEQRHGKVTRECSCVDLSLCMRRLDVAAWVGPCILLAMGMFAVPKQCPMLLRDGKALSTYTYAYLCNRQSSETQLQGMPLQDVCAGLLLSVQWLGCNPPS